MDDGKAKYRERYAALQQIYEARLQNLGEKLEKAVHEIHTDESIALLQQNSISRDFVGQRIHELIAHALSDEKEHFIKTLSDKLAKKDADLKQLVRERDALHGQKKSVLDEMNHVASQVETLQVQYNAIVRQVDVSESEIERLRLENRSLIEELSSRDQLEATWSQEKQTFLDLEHELVRIQTMYSKDQAYYSQALNSSSATIEDLQKEVAKAEAELSAMTANMTTLRLEIQEKSIAYSHQKQINESLTAKLARLEPLENQLSVMASAHQTKLHELEMEKRDVERKYQAVGEQVEALIRDHDDEVARAGAVHEQEMKKAKEDVINLQAQFDNEKSRFVEQIATLEGQIKERDTKLHDALTRAHNLEAKVAALEVAKTQLKLNLTKRITSLEDELAGVSKEGLEALGKERQLRENVEGQFASFKRMAEVKMSSLAAALESQKQATLRHGEAEKRLKWQEEAMHKHEKLVEQMKNKYEKSMTALQSQLAAASKPPEREAESKIENIILPPVQEPSIPLTMHKAELEKLEATSTLRMQQQLEQEREHWRKKLDEAQVEKSTEMLEQVEAIKTECAQEKQKVEEYKAQIQQERKQLMELKATLRDESIAKTLLIQRLEEASLHLGRLKAVVSQQQSVLADWECKYSALKIEFEEIATRFDAVKNEKSRLQNDLRGAIEEREKSTIAMRHLQQDFSNAKTLFEERDASVQLDLRNKATRIHSLEATLSDLKSKEIEIMEKFHSDESLRNATWTAQVEALKAKIASLEGDNQTKREENLHAIETIQQQLTTIERLDFELRLKNQEIEQIKIKKQHYKQAVESHKASLEAAHQAQNALKSEFKKSQWFTNGPVDYKLLQQTVRHLLPQDPNYDKVAVETFRLQAEKIFQTLHGAQARQLAEAKEMWSIHEQEKINRIQNEHTIALANQSDKFQIQLQIQKDEASLSQSKLTTTIQDRDAQLQALAAQIVQFKTDLQSLEQQMELRKVNVSHETELLKRQLGERDRMFAEKVTQLETVEKRLNEVNIKLMEENQRSVFLSDVLTRVSLTVTKEPLPEGFMESPASVKQLAHNWIENVISTVQKNQDRAIASAIQPLKDELEKQVVVEKTIARETPIELVPQIENNEALSEVSEELMKAKETIQQLKAEAQILHEEINKLRTKNAKLEQSCDQLIEEKDTLQTCLNLVEHEMKVAQSTYSTRCHDAFVQSEEDMAQLKSTWTREVERLRMERDHAVAELQKDLEAESQQKTKLRVALSEQERQFKQQIQELVKRNHALVQRQVDQEASRHHTRLPRKEHAQPPSLRGGPSKSSMHELSVLMEQSLKASREEFHSKVKRDQGVNPKSS
ncbi:hypothetical protein Ae201684P_020398 [Aphanomyces euteiches]|nr:hypothetical protein Ae201684P_020398 [Aphanomyces euteiches]